MMVLARSIGPVARQVLAGGGTGEILATFARSLHIAVGAHLVCIVDEALGNGPLNIRLSASAMAGLAGLPVGTACSIKRRALHISDTVVDASRAAAWSPPQPGPWASAAQRRMLWECITREGCNRAPRDSFFHAAYGSPAHCDTLLMKAARHRLNDLMIWAENPADTPPLHGLIGLGQGLTPAGDDVIGGMAMAFHAWQTQFLAQAFSRALSGLPDDVTTPVSAALLAAAGQGFGHEALHAVIVAIQTGQADRLDNHFSCISAIGHSSGWDGLAGVLTGIALCEKWRISGHLTSIEKLTAA
ncbi:MAG: DUF2877 domain-containing protein [Beijerinckiaceae bacterium]